MSTPDLSQKTSDQLASEVRGLVDLNALSMQHGEYQLIRSYLDEIDRRRKARSCL
jgi:hypothetical protein